MAREIIDVATYAEKIIKGIKGTALLTSVCQGRVNTMAIGWGLLGIAFDRPVLQVFVRHSRLTHDYLAAQAEFTVNIPLQSMPREVFNVAGSASGRDVDKIASLHLTCVPAMVVAAPAIQELPLTLECRALAYQDLAIDTLPPALRQAKYPARLAGPDEAVARDVHTAYLCEILAAYILR